MAPSRWYAEVPVARRSPASATADTAFYHELKAQTLAGAAAAEAQL